MATQQTLVPWTGMNKGQTLDSTHSFATLDCDDTGTLMLFGHLYQTNQVSAQLHLYYKLDASAPIDTGIFFPTSADGTADFAFSLEGLSSGSHGVTIEINHTAPELTYYVNQTAVNDANTRIPFTSPGASSQLGGQSLVAWTGVNKGQTLDSTHSFVAAQCDDSRTLIVFGHLSQTNQPNAPFLVYYKLDAGTPILTQGSYTTRADGTGDFAFSVEGMTSGSHAVITEINFGPNPGLTYYMNSGGPDNVGIPFTCP